MSDIIRHGTIVIDLKTGKIDLPAPDLAEVLKTTREQADAQAAVNAQIEMTQNSVHNITNTTKTYNVEINKTINNSHNLAQAMRTNFDVGAESAFRLSRAMVLLGVQSEDSLHGMIRNLASVHAGIDMFKGSVGTVRALGMAFGASEVAMTGLLTKLNPYLAILSATATAYGVYATNARAAAQAEQDLNKAIKDGASQREAKARNDLESEQDRSKRLAFEGADSAGQMRILHDKLDSIDRAIKFRETARAGRHRNLTLEQNAAMDPDPAVLKDFNARSLKLQNDRTEIRRQLQAIEDGQAQAMLEGYKQGILTTGEMLGDVFRQVLQQVADQRKQVGFVTQAIRSLSGK